MSGRLRQKLATVVRVPDRSIRLDGRLDDAAWNAAPAITDFTQKEPIEGVPATERMEVKLHDVCGVAAKSRRPGPLRHTRRTRGYLQVGQIARNEYLSREDVILDPGTLDIGCDGK